MANPELYRLAILPDLTLIPFKAQGPYYTPPIENYLQDGEYENITKKYEIQYGNDLKEQLNIMMKELAARRKRSKKKSEDDE